MNWGNLMQVNFIYFLGIFEIFFRSLGHMGIPGGAKKGHFWPKKDAKWPKLTYDALEGSKWP